MELLFEIYNSYIWLVQFIRIGSNLIQINFIRMGSNNFHN